MSERENSLNDRLPRGENDRYTDQTYHHHYGDYDKAYAGQSDPNVYRDQNNDVYWDHYDNLQTQQEFHEHPDYYEPVNYPGREFLDDSFDPSTHYQSNREDPHFSETEEVWVKESQNRISYNDSDLIDVEQRRSSRLFAPLAGVAGVAAMLGLIGFLALSSLPDLTPEEIIAMQGYAGEQPTKTPFNLADLRECSTLGNCDEKAAAASPGTNNTVSITESTTQVANNIVDPTEYVEYVDTTRNDSNGYTTIQEIPAATTYAINSSESYNSSNYDSSSYDSSSYNQQLTVLKQWSNVRGAPNSNAEILTSLAVGTEVTVLNQSGNWYEVMVKSKQDTVGYMHNSTVAAR